MDEDFFLYHEEVAFCRVAQRRGWRVEFDPSVSVVHRHPLQNRAISPKMRVITRHSKLLYFRKHLPRWQFRTLAAIVSLEAAIRGGWSVHARTPGRGTGLGRDRARSPVGCVAVRSVRGRDILSLAESIARPVGPVGGRAGVPRETGIASGNGGNGGHAAPAAGPWNRRKDGSA